MLLKSKKYIFKNFNLCEFYAYLIIIYVNITDGQTEKHIKSIVRNLKKSDLTLLEINVISEVPFYYINKFK